MKLEIPTIGRVVLVRWASDGAPTPCLVQGRFNPESTPAAIEVRHPSHGLVPAQHRSSWSIDCGFNYSWEWPERQDPVFVEL